MDNRDAKSGHVQPIVRLLDLSYRPGFLTLAVLASFCSGAFIVMAADGFLLGLKTWPVDAVVCCALQAFTVYCWARAIPPNTGLSGGTPSAEATRSGGNI